MAPSKGPSAVVALPRALQPLADQLAKLPPEDREKVIAAARSVTDQDKRAANDTKRRYRTMSWESLMSAKGIVHLGGNAVDDCNALYDGVVVDANVHRRVPS